MAAILACGPGAVLSHRSAAELLRIIAGGATFPIHISVAANVNRSLPGTTIHRRRPFAVIPIGEFRGANPGFGPCAGSWVGSRSRLPRPSSWVGSSLWRAGPDCRDR